MTASELYELVKPLIGTEWEPEGLTFNGAVWIHADIARSEDGYGAAFPIPAARAMWETSIMDGLYDVHWFDGIDNQHHVTVIEKGKDVEYTGPTRLHALVAAAVACNANPQNP